MFMKVDQHNIVWKCIIFYKNQLKKNKIDISDTTLFLIAIGHDLDKIGRYRSKWNNFAYIPKRRLAQYHGGNSFALLKSFINEDFETHPDYAIINLCIYTHMGDYGEIHPKSEYHEYKESVPMVKLTHEADNRSCELEKENKDG